MEVTGLSTFVGSPVYNKIYEIFQSSKELLHVYR